MLKCNLYQIYTNLRFLNLYPYQECILYKNQHPNIIYVGLYISTLVASLLFHNNNFIFYLFIFIIYFYYLFLLFINILNIYILILDNI